MRAVLIRIRTGEQTGQNYRTETVPGWLVDDVDGTLAVDLRVESNYDAVPPYPGEYAITHIPTGLRIKRPGITDCLTNKWEAARIAKGFYDEAKRRGWDIRSVNPQVFAVAFEKLTSRDIVAFWDAVANPPPSPSGASGHG